MFATSAGNRRDEDSMAGLDSAALTLGVTVPPLRKDGSYGLLFNSRGRRVIRKNPNAGTSASGTL